MGNAIDSFASGFAKAIGDLFNGPLHFLSGKSCSSVCSPTWDFICYIEHFCVANLLKLGLIILALYIVLFFFYLSYKLGIFHCIFHTLCKTLWTCFAMCFYVLDHIFNFLCQKLLSPRRRRRRRRRSCLNEHVKDIEDIELSSDDNDKDDEDRAESSCCSTSSEIIGSRQVPSRRWTEHRRRHLRSSLKPRSHRVQVEISRLSKRCPSKHRNRHHSMNNMHDSVRVTRTSKFAQKGMNRRRIGVHRSGRGYSYMK